MSGLRKRKAPKYVDSESDDDGELPKASAIVKKSKTTAKKTGQASKSKKELKCSDELRPWHDHDLLSELQNIPVPIATNIIQLFQDDNTIPFICRYRRDLIDHMSPEKMLEIKISYGQICQLRQRIDTVLKNLEKDKVLTTGIRSDILSAKSLDELEHLYAPFKPASKKSLYERAKALNLEGVADNLLFGRTAEINFHSLVKPSVAGLENESNVRSGIKNIITHLIAKNPNVLAEIRQLKDKHRIELTSKEVVNKTTNKENVKKDNDSRKRQQEAQKFQNYFQFSCPIRFIKSHQVLAINRGENLKILSVKVEVPDSLKFELKRFVENLYMRQGNHFKARADLFQESFEEMYAKKLQPLIVRQIRSELTKHAEKESIAIFAANLKQLLLQATTKGEPILGIDPGFTNGCKLAMISECSKVLETGVVYPHNSSKWLEYGQQMAQMMKKHNCKLIALGNATACRETEAWLSKLFDHAVFDSTSVRYCIISEQGASTYSCSKIAKQEFPDMDVNEISAVSLARRLNDPLCEFVKVEPQHLGLGMYQHDLNEKQLVESLDEVVMECVSFVGVDINTASVSLLSHVAGLTEKRADYIVKHRLQHGPFKSREELKKVKFVGDKSFVQCAGFVRIEPLTAGPDGQYNLLDSTWVHPESYELAEAIIRRCTLSNRDIGSSRFIEKVRTFAAVSSSDALEKEFRQPFERIKTVIEALSRELLRDYRADVNLKPMFKQGLTKMSDLKMGTIVTGAITNITAFGCFVDIGVECNGLIHVSKLNGLQTKIGNRVETKVLSVDTSRSRIGLNLEKVLD